MRPYKAHWIKNPGRRLHPARQKAIPLSRCARVRFAPPFVPKGEDKRGAPYFDHPLRNEGGRQARRTLLRSPSSERRGKTSTAHPTSITLFGTKWKTSAARRTSITPFGTKGEDKHGAPYFDHPLRDEGGRREAPGGCHCASGQNDTVGPQAIVTNSSAEVGWIATVRR